MFTQRSSLHKDHPSGQMMHGANSVAGNRCYKNPRKATPGEILAREGRGIKRGVSGEEILLAYCARRGGGLCGEREHFQGVGGLFWEVVLTLWSPRSRFPLVKIVANSLFSRFPLKNVAVESRGR